jgi:hypothetical protein
MKLAAQESGTRIDHYPAEGLPAFAFREQPVLFHKLMLQPADIGIVKSYLG